MEPDFLGLAQAWIDNDPRLASVDGEKKEQLVRRLAEALDRRRTLEAAEDPPDTGLIVQVDRDHFSRSEGLSKSALDQLEAMLKERIEQELDEQN